MHTATQIWFDRFTAEAEGKPIASSSVLDWAAQDRFGIVVDEPFGALGAGLLISLAVASFYDVPGKERRSRNLYPEIYLFHVGRRWGDFSPFDFWPERKEVCVPADPATILQSINTHAITHLAVTVGATQVGNHVYREQEIAHDRIKQCFAYAPSGSVEGSDMLIRSSDPGVMANYSYTLQPEFWLPETEKQVDADDGTPLSTPELRDLKRVVAHTHERWNEVPRNDPAFAAALEKVRLANSACVVEERYRRITTQDAINWLL
jgi:hypothetical protein